MTIKVGINGFGRIGRMVFRAAIANHQDIQVVAINDLLEPDYLAYMLLHDSVHGRFKGTVALDGHTLIVNGKRIRLTAKKDPAELKWGEVGADVVVESTGLFLTQETCRKHLGAGAMKVIMCAPSKDDTPMFVYGVNDKTYADAKAVIEAMKARGAEVPIPTDVVVATEFKADAKAVVKAAADVAADEMILDIGPQTAARLAARLERAGTIVWNGPVGVFEFDAFAQGTETIARAIAGSAAFSIAGGGDTLAAIAKYGVEKDMGYISTGGGAFLEVLEGKTLPAFEILQRRAA